MLDELAGFAAVPFVVGEGTQHHLYVGVVGAGFAQNRLHSDEFGLVGVDEPLPVLPLGRRADLLARES